MKTIECGTCKFNAIGCHNSSECLLHSPGLVYKTINGERYRSLYWYWYYLWMPVKQENYLPERLFEI